jgi:hypothetical protein
VSIKAHFNPVCTQKNSLKLLCFKEIHAVQNPHIKAPYTQKMPFGKMISQELTVKINQPIRPLVFADMPEVNSCLIASFLCDIL